MTESPGQPGDTLLAVLFDMDGTLVATEEYWGEAMFELAARLGGRMSDRARAATVGTSMRTSMRVLHQDLRLTRSEDQLHADARWVEERAAQLMAAGIAWQPGARDLVVGVRTAGLATGLVTTTPRRVAEVVLHAINEDLGGNPFDVTVCADEVPARKPDPAPYRQAMAALQVRAAECLVIEDSPVGMAAGLAAGATVLGVPSVRGVEPAPGLALRTSLAGIGIPELVRLLVPGATGGAPADRHARALSDV